MALIEFWVDRKLRLVDSNAEFQRVYNYSRGEEGPLYYVVFPRITFDGRDAVEAVLESGKPLSLTGYRFGCLESYVSGNVSISPEGTLNHPPDRAHVAVDIVKECEIAQRLKESEHLIDIGKTASSLAHGFRNPLNAIKAGVVFLKEKYPQEKILQDFFGIMEEEIGRLDDFITDFLRNSFKKSTPPECNINGLLKKIELITAMQAETEGVKIEFHYGEIPAVQVDPREFEQAVLNVLNNSMEVLPQGGKIKVESCSEPVNGARFVQVSISDDGPGIQENSIGAFSAPLTGAAKATGKGFGLFLAREAMKRHHGQFEIQTRHGQGTTVIFRLPVNQAG